MSRTMQLLNETELNLIMTRLEYSKIRKWHLEDFEDKMIGYLGDHLKLIIEAEKDGVKREFQLFVKCMPRFDKWKCEYLQELKFFDKEYVMLSKLFQHFRNGESAEKWRPNLHYVREDLFVFEDVSKLGYKMPHYKEVMKIEALKATVKTVARFHAQSYIYEEKKSRELGKEYRIWDEFSEFLQEPLAGMKWRNTGRNAVIDYLKVFSTYKSNSYFLTKLDEIVSKLYEKSMDLMKPSDKYRNVVVHRDLWANNILIKDDGISEPHALIVDFQTVLYSSPMLDLLSLIYFNTSKSDRKKYANKLINIYYDSLSTILEEANIDIDTILPKHVLMEAYNDSLLFGLTQASIIVPIISMSSKRREEIFCDPVRSEKANIVSRSEEFIEIANEDTVYKNRVSELFDEIVERYVYFNKVNDVDVISCE